MGVLLDRHPLRGSRRGQGSEPAPVAGPVLRLRYDGGHGASASDWSLIDSPGGLV
jgi:hypothetical protein